MGVCGGVGGSGIFEPQEFFFVIKFLVRIFLGHSMSISWDFRAFRERGLNTELLSLGTGHFANASFRQLPVR